MKPPCLTVAIAAALCVIGAARAAHAADQVIFIVRHAERAQTPEGQPPPKTMMADDPPLSPAGQQRAARLAAILASAGVKYIFTTEYQRTRQTAAPLAAKLNLRPVMSASKDPEPLVAQVRKAPGNVLIVGHANTVPDLLKRLGVKQPVTIGENDYDNLLVVVRRDSGEPALIRLRY
jgi:broad specificity phosphatase PhoE